MDSLPSQFDNRNIQKATHCITITFRQPENLARQGLYNHIPMTRALQAPNEIIIFIISQQEEYYLQLAQNLRSEIYNQSIRISKDDLINVKLIHETFNSPGDWTFLNILPQLSKTNIIKSNIKWIIFCEEQSNINLKILLNELNKEDHTKELYLGHPIYDLTASIIHHFAFFEYSQWFPYPLIRSGIAFTIPLIKRLTERVLDSKPTTDFFIDASHELSLFIWNNIKIKKNIIKKNNIMQNIKIISNNKIINSNDITYAYKKKLLSNTRPQKGLLTNEIILLPEEIKIINNTRTTSKSIENNKIKNLNEDYKEKGILLTNAPYFCSQKRFNCGIYPNPVVNITCIPIKMQTIYFAIKTCRKFHSERIPIIESTWGRFIEHKRYFSDFEDSSIPTISTNIENTEIGHCSKTLRILKLAFDEIEKLNEFVLQKKLQIKWLVLTDDDTILSISTLCDILGCFNPENEIYLGERYGYRLNYKDGFNYITGGGGIVFSLRTIKKIIERCTCPSDSSPDDMIIGSCLNHLDVPVIHSARFHQARPKDYCYKLLTLESPISFHKYWHIDPIEIYKEWFQQKDEKLFHKFNKKIDNRNCVINNCGKFRKYHLKNNQLRKLQEVQEFINPTTTTKSQSHIDL